MSDFPNIRPDAVTWGCVANVATFESELSNTVQVQAIGNSRWEGQLTFTNRSGDEAQSLKAFLAGLEGPTGRFNLLPPDLNQRGTMSGDGRVTGSNQTGKTLNTNGWTANQARLFAAGDYISVANRVYMITQDVASSATGTATLTLNRPLVNTPNNLDVIARVGPRVKCMLVDGAQAQFSVSAPFIYAVTISFIEDLL